MRFEPAVRGAYAHGVQMMQEVGMVIHLARRAEGAERLVADVVEKERPEAARLHARADQALDESDRSKLEHERRVEADLIDAVDDAARGLRQRGALDRVDADDDNVARRRAQI